MYADPLSETRTGTFYVPRDEEFSEVKENSFITKTAESVLDALLPSLKAVLLDDPGLGFQHFSDIDQLYNQGMPIPKVKNQGPLQSIVLRLVKAIEDADDVVKFETPAMFHSKKKPSHPHLSSCLSHTRTEAFLNLQRTSSLGFGMRNSHAKPLLVLTHTV